MHPCCCNALAKHLQQTSSMHAAGSLFLFDRNQLKSFRRDNHVWKSKAGGKTVQETHEKLKVLVLQTCTWVHAE